MIEIIKISKETFVERMKACCPNRFSDEALFLLYTHLNGDANEPWTEDNVLIEEKYWCEAYKETSIEEYVSKYPVQEFEELGGANQPLDRRIIMTNLLRDKYKRHEIVGFTETTIIYCDY